MSNHFTKIPSRNGNESSYLQEISQVESRNSTLFYSLILQGAVLEFEFRAFTLEPL
jgi:hypothetical protein